MSEGPSPRVQMTLCCMFNAKEAWKDFYKIAFNIII